MKEQINNAIEFLKNQDFKGCITGSCLLDYFPGQDIDVFAYDEASFTRMLYCLQYNDMFHIIDDLELWKFKEYTEKNSSSLNKLGLVSIKFKYNTCVDVNVIFKKGKNNIFSVISSFDMDIIATGYDLATKQTLSLSQNDGKTAHWNKWNTQFYDVNIWGVGRLLRQFNRCVKYHERGYNTDNIVKKYQEILTGFLHYKNIFDSVKVEEKVDNVKEQANILNKIFDIWLEKHELSDVEKELIAKTIKNLM